MTTNDKPYKPVGHPSVSPYLRVRSADRAVRFLTTTFGGTELCRHRRPDGTVQHVEVRIDDAIVMLGERPDAGAAQAACAVHVYVEDVDACHARALQAGGTSLYAPVDQPYGDRGAGVADEDGNLWWIGTHRAGGERARR